ncbi:Multicopper oxidase [Gigaspora rosea]|uniref:Multicopper oxidase n=1 Tax=Gigaspora rosea TaxID=44941 RepID=A0A397VR44_9GLOM|nr:Multicopper oxidase [Gigaspora rosea]
MILSKSLSLWTILCILALLNSLAFILASPIKKHAYVPETKTFYLHLYKAKLSPDGFERVVWTVNGTYPGPTLVVTKGDRLIIHIINNLGEPTSIHFHGFFQRGTNWYDGVPGQTQCPIPNNTTFIYNFTIPDQSGTFWYHSHYLAQYVDGVLGAIIVKDPNDPYQNDYDEEIVVLLSDWYHNESSTLISYYLSPASEGKEPQPDNGLIDGRNNYHCEWALASHKCIDKAGLSKFNFVPGKRYRLRVINTSAFSNFIFSIDEHEMDLIEVEGMMTKRHKIHRLIINVAQRYSVIVTADKLVSNFWMRADLQTDCFDDSSDQIVHLNPYVKAIVHYEGANNLDPTTKGWADNPNYHDHCVDLNTSDIKPLFLENVPAKADQIIYLNASFENDDFNINRGLINGSTYVIDIYNPTINQVLFENKHSFPPNQNVFGQFNTSQVIDIVVYNDDDGEHPFHLHGHTFWVLGSGEVNTEPDYSKLNIYDPIRRDTATIPAEGWIVIRFVADNPGIWAFHCHIEWHVEAGLVAQFVELPNELRELKPPDDWEQLCIKSTNPYNLLKPQSEPKIFINDMRNIDILIKNLGWNWGEMEFNWNYLLVYFLNLF